MFYKVGSLVNRATREKLTQAAMRRLKIHLRPMSKQVSIVSTLSKTKQIIDLRRVQLAKLDELVKCRFAIQASLDKTQQLFDSLMQEYFG